MSVPFDDPNTLSTKEVADVLQITTKSLHNWLRKQEIPEPRRNPLTRRMYWTPEDVERIRQIKAKDGL